MGVNEILPSHRYTLSNACFRDRVLTFPTASSDNRPIIWHAKHGDDTQKVGPEYGALHKEKVIENLVSQWEFQNIDNDWHIRNVSNGLYVAVEGLRDTKNDYATGTRIVGSQEPYRWEAVLKQHTFFIFKVPGTEKRLEFSKDGVDHHGRVGDPYSLDTHQLWYLDEIKRVIVIAGLEDGGGVGAAVARLFAKRGFAIAFMATPSESLNQLQREPDSIPGVEAVTFPLSSHSASAIVDSWESIKERFPSSSYEIRVVVWNSHPPVSKKFLDVTPEDIERSTQINIIAAFTFARQAILTFKGHTSIETTTRKHGTLIFSAGAAPGNAFTSAFDLFKPALRSLSQNLNKEFGSEDIHVAHVILENFVSSDRRVQGVEKEDLKRRAEGIAKSYLHLVDQDKSILTSELDLRPAQHSRSRALGMELLDLLARVDGL